MTHNRSRGRPPHKDVLTPAEWKVTHAVQHGMTNREVAERKGVSIEAVKFHVANVLAKLGLPNRRALRHWFRAPKGSALDLKSAARGENAVNAFAGLATIGQISRSVSDIQAAERWYGQVLGLKHLYTFGKLAFFDCGGARLFLTQESAAAGPESVLYFRVEDIEAAHATLTERGVEFVQAPHLIHRHPDGLEEWMAFFKDPDGRVLAIMAQVRPRG